MLFKRSHAEVCCTYPGGDEDLIVRTDTEILARWRLRNVAYEEAARPGRIRVEGSRSYLKAFIGCIRPSPSPTVEPAPRRQLLIRLGGLLARTQRRLGDCSQ
jgi:hypothetical protein